MFLVGRDFLWVSQSKLFFMECKHDKSEFNTSIVEILHGCEISGRNANYWLLYWNKTALKRVSKSLKYCAKLSILKLGK